MMTPELLDEVKRLIAMLNVSACTSGLITREAILQILKVEKLIIKTEREATPPP